MANTSIASAAAIEYFAIHQATCRARRQGLCCGTCSELAERAIRAEAKDVREPVEMLVIIDGAGFWSRAA